MGDEKNQVALCAMVDDGLKNRTEKALLKAKISYLMKCERHIEKNSKENKVVFYIEQHQIDKAIEAISELELEGQKMELLY